MAIDLMRRRDAVTATAAAKPPAHLTWSTLRARKFPVVTEKRGYALLIVAPALLMGGFFVYPFLDLIIKSFSSPTGAFGNYLELLSDQVFQTALKNTFLFALATSVGTAILGYPVAVLLASVRPGLAQVLLLLVMVPFWTSVVIRCYAWIVLLGRQGILNSTLVQIGIVNEPLELMFNSAGVIIGMIHVMLPYMILPIFSVFSRLNKDVLSAADSLGATRLQVFIRVLLPLTFPGVLGGLVLVFVLSLGFFITPALMGGPRDVVAAMVIHDRITRQLAWDQAAAVSVILLLLTAGTFLIAGQVFGLRRYMSISVR